MLQTDKLTAAAPSASSPRKAFLRKKSCSNALCARKHWPIISARPKPKSNWRFFIEAAKKRGEALDHTFIIRPAGITSKTTELAHVIAKELGVNLRQTSGPVLERAGDFGGAAFTNLEPHDVLFIDEIHRLSPVVEEILYPGTGRLPARYHDGEGPAARSVKIDLPPFHIGGRHHPRRYAHQPLARPLGIVSAAEFYENP